MTQTVTVRHFAAQTSPAALAAALNAAQLGASLTAPRDRPKTAGAWVRVWTEHVGPRGHEADCLLTASAHTMQPGRREVLAPLFGPVDSWQRATDPRATDHAPRTAPQSLNISNCCTGAAGTPADSGGLARHILHSLPASCHRHASSWRCQWGLSASLKVHICTAAYQLFD